MAHNFKKPKNDGKGGFKNPICNACVHYYVTWQPSHPHGCRALSFKSLYLPSVEVRRTSGKPCQYFSPKKR